MCHSLLSHHRNGPPRRPLARFSAVFALTLLTALSGLARGQAEEESPSPLSNANYEALLQRLSDVEAELAILRESVPVPASESQVPGVISPTSAEWLPPSPVAPGLLTFAPPAAAAPPAPPTKFPTVQVNGFFQADTLFYDQSLHNREQLGDIQDGADFRRTRLSASGAVAENVNYFLQLDFGFFGRPTFTDVWGEIKDIPLLGTVRVGQWKQPYSLEVPTSVRYQTFMERSLLFQAFDPFRHIGAGFYNNDEAEDWTWAMSVFRVGNDQFGGDIGDAGGWSSAGRLTHLLYYQESADTQKRLDYLHVGAAYWVGDPGNDVFRYFTIPESFVGAFGVPAAAVPGTSRVHIPTLAQGTPPFVDTGAIATNTFAHVGTEFLWANGPFTVQSEVQFANVAQIGGPDLHFWGFYSQWMYFLTGESRPYNRKLGTLDRITPLRPFIREADCERGPGAWELAMRLSHINLNDENISGGRLTDLTAGLNWYLNGYTKVQFNYIYSMLDRNFNGYDGSSRCGAYGARLQVDF